MYVRNLSRAVVTNEEIKNRPTTFMISLLTFLYWLAICYGSFMDYCIYINIYIYICNCILYTYKRIFTQNSITITCIHTWTYEFFGNKRSRSIPQPDHYGGYLLPYKVIKCDSRATGQKYCPLITR